MWYPAPCSQTPPHDLPKRTKSIQVVPTRAAKPEVNAVLRRLRNLGLQLEFSAGAGHWRVLDPGTGAFLTTVSGTPSDVNWWHHVRRAVERAGFSWEGRARKKIKKSRGGGEVSAIDLEALAHAQHMARIHGGREPRIDDLADKSFLARVRRGYNEQETEEAIAHMPQGVESARAHRVVSRLLYTVEQRGEELAARALERNPKVRDGITHELMHISKETATKRGLRYWKTPESAWQTLSNLLNGTSAGMSIWVANLLEATMDEIDGLRWDSAESKHPEPVAVVSTGISDPLEQHGEITPPSISLEEAKDWVLAVLGAEWTTRTNAHDALVPEHMSSSRFEDALASLVKAGRAERERERKKQGGTLYRLPAPKPEPVAKPAKVRLSQPEVDEIVQAAIGSDWTLRGDIAKVAAQKGVTPRTFERSLSRAVNAGLAERERLASGKAQYRLSQPAPVPQPDDEGPLFIPPEMLPETPRSFMQALTAGTVADRYADVLLEILRTHSSTTNGQFDWTNLEPILTRLDKLAGVGVADVEE